MRARGRAGARARACAALSVFLNSMTTLLPYISEPGIVSERNETGVGSTHTHLRPGAASRQVGWGTTHERPARWRAFVCPAVRCAGAGRGGAPEARPALRDHREVVELLRAAVLHRLQLHQEL
jgi:hypothetical protein